jgi:hypothetical protein
MDWFCCIFLILLYSPLLDVNLSRPDLGVTISKFISRPEMSFPVLTMSRLGVRFLSSWSIWIIFFRWT